MPQSTFIKLRSGVKQSLNSTQEECPGIQDLDRTARKICDCRSFVVDTQILVYREVEDGAFV